MENLNINNTSNGRHQEMTDPFQKARLLPHTFHDFVATYMIIMGILAIVGNGTVLTVYMKNRDLISTTNMFVIALAISDMSEAILGNPFIAASSIAKAWIFGHAGCKWYAFIMTFLGLNSIVLLTAVSVDRFIIMAKPLLSPYITPRRVLICIMLCILYSFFWSVVPLVGWSAYDIETPYTSCSIRWQSRDWNNISYCICLFVFCFFVPLITIGYCYYNIYGTVFHATRVHSLSENRKIRRKNKKVERQIVRITISVTVSYLINWTPYAVVSFWSAFGNPDDISPIAGAIPALLAKGAIIYNPFIITFMNQQFRRRACELLPCKCLRGILSRNHVDNESNHDDESMTGDRNSRSRPDSLTDPQEGSAAKRTIEQNGGKVWATKTSKKKNVKMNTLRTVTPPFDSGMVTELTSCYPAELSAQELAVLDKSSKERMDIPITEEPRTTYSDTV